jgi:hypothetical protein
MGSSGSDPTLPARAGDGEATRALPYREPAAHTQPTDRVQPSYQPTEVVSHPATEGVPRQPKADAAYEPPPIAMPRQPTADVASYEPVAYQPPPEPVTDGPPPSEAVRYGPGVPASQAGIAAESIWRTGHRPGPPPPRQIRLRRLLGAALTVALLAAAGVVLYLRFFDHPPFHVTGVVISAQAKTGCAVDVTGRIATNGATGTVSYQWVFRPQTQAPQPQNVSVIAGQHAVYVTVAVEGQGHGSGSQTVTLQVLGPDQETASKNVVISC